MNKFQQIRQNLHDLIKADVFQLNLVSGLTRPLVELDLTPKKESHHETIRCQIQDGKDPVDTILLHVMQMDKSLLSIAQKLESRDIDHTAKPVLRSFEELNYIGRQSRQDYSFLLDDNNIQEIEIHQIDKQKARALGEDLYFNLTFKPTPEIVKIAEQNGLYKKIATVYAPQQAPMDFALEIAFTSTQSLERSWTENLNVKAESINAYSSSVGDVFVANGKGHLVASFGFKDVEDFGKPIAPQRNQDLTSGPSVP